MADQPDPQLSTEPEAAPPAPDSGLSEERKATLAERRKTWLIRLASAVAVVAVLWGAYYLLIGRNRVSTDNAYVGAETALVTPLVAGAVDSVRVSNTQAVKKGDVLLTIDQADARIAVARAEADLAQAERKYRETGATGGALAAQVTARGSDIARAEAELIVARAQADKTRIDLQRRQDLAKSGAVSGEELTAARSADAAARAQLRVAAAGIAQARASRTAAQQQYEATQALASGPIAANPDVAAARARLAAARLDLERTMIRAPFDGVVAQRSVQVGQRIAPGNPIMTIVPLDRMYVDANFKESQLRKVRIGQPVKLESDLYGGGVEYHGKVVGMAGGTGSAFAIIPAQNATGNWIKVVQRLPVRIALDPQELRNHPLRVGLSMDVKIDVGG